MIKKYLLKIWREFPIWLQWTIARLVRPSYRVAVAAIILDEQGRILLCKHTYRKARPWGIPGGSLEYGEDPEEAISREIFEETGLKVKVKRLLLAESSKEDHHVSLIYSCRIISGSFKSNIEVSQTRFFKLNKLPNLLQTEKTLLERLSRMNII